MTDRPNPEEPERDPSAPNEPVPLESPRPEPSSPAQIAPEPGAAPIPFEPEPSVPEPVSPEPEAPVAYASESEATLALPPTTKEVEPPPVPSAPPPPTGARVPFAAPPTMRSRFFGLKLGLGIGGGALLIGGIVIAVFVAAVTLGNSVIEKVEGTAEEFIGAVAEDDWDTAYAMLCDEYRERPADDYIDEWDSWDADGAEVQLANPSNTEVVTVEFDDGTAIDLFIRVDQSAEALDTSVCGWRSVPAGE